MFFPVCAVENHTIMSPIAKGRWATTKNAKGGGQRNIKSAKKSCQKTKQPLGTLVKPLKSYPYVHNPCVEPSHTGDIQHTSPISSARITFRRLTHE